MKVFLQRTIGTLLLMGSVALACYIALSVIGGGVILIDSEKIVTQAVVIGVPGITGAALIWLGIHEEKEKEKFLRALFSMAFFVYSLALLGILFLARLGLLYEESSYFINLVPFMTIGEYVVRFMDHSINRDIVVQNLLGNLLLFAPMGVFLPVLFKKMEKGSRFLLTIIIMLVSVEVLQCLLRVGSCDIDDFILNFAGAYAAYGITKRIVKRN